MHQTDKTALQSFLLGLLVDLEDGVIRSFDTSENFLETTQSYIVALHGHSSNK
jgi:hypothetical protein